MQQLGLFSSEDNKPLRTRRPKSSDKQLSLFAPDDMVGTGKQTELHAGYTPRLALISEDPRTSEEKEADRTQEAQSRTLNMFGGKS